MLRFLSLMVLITCSNSARAEDPDIDAILKGENQRAAWNRIVERGPSELPLLLDALGTRDNAAANWLRTAYDRIVDRELAAGGKRINPDFLIHFVEDSQKLGRARRLALETAEAMKPGIRARLLASWLDDPEFRFDAIVEVVKKADSLPANEAKAELAKAFAASRDIEQAKSIAVKLDKLQVPVSVAKHLGCVLDWKVIGPFDAKNMKGFSTVYPPEEKIDLTAEYPGKSGPVKWKPFVLKEPNPSSGGRFGLINLLVPFGQQHDAVAYAYTSIRVEKAVEAEFRGAADDNLTVWVNGKRVFGFEEYRNGVRPDRHRFKVMLKEGDNAVLLKICQSTLDTANADPNWEFLLRIVDGKGKGLAFTTNP